MEIKIGQNKKVPEGDVNTAGWL